MALCDSSWILLCNSVWENRDDVTFLLFACWFVFLFFFFSCVLHSVEMRLLSLGNVPKSLVVNNPTFPLVVHEVGDHHSTLFICHITEMYLLLWVCLIELIIFFQWPGHRISVRELLVILLAELHTFMQEKNKPLYFKEFSQNVLIWNAKFIIYRKL